MSNGAPAYRNGCGQPSRNEIKNSAEGMARLSMKISTSENNPLYDTFSSILVLYREVVQFAYILWLSFVERLSSFFFKCPLSVGSTAWTKVSFSEGNFFIK